VPNLLLTGCYLFCREPSVTPRKSHIVSREAKPLKLKTKNIFENCFITLEGEPAMKKQIVILNLTFLFFLFTVNYAFAGATFKLGFDTSGDHEVSVLGVTASEDVEDSISASFEGVGFINDNVGIGGGVTYQFPRSQDRFKGDFYFIPVYGLIKIRSASKKAAPYGIGQIGYNIIFEGDNDYKGTGIYAADLDGGLYYGIGAGVIISEKFQIEVLYSVNNGTATILGTEFDIEYSKVTLSVGVNF